MNERENRIHFETRDLGDGIVVLKMSGDLDMYTLPKAKEKVNEMIDSGENNIVMDLEGVEYVDSSGLGFFIGTLKKLRMNSGDLKLVSLNNYIYGIFKLIHLHYIIEICETLDEAKEKLLNPVKESD